MSSITVGSSGSPPAEQETTFQLSLVALKRTLTSASKKRARLDTLEPTRLQDLICEVSKAQIHYDSKNQHSVLRKGLIAFSKRVQHYGKVLDVMAQHHPEYVSLAWGTMKLIFGAVVEHARIGLTIVTALNDIGDVLSRVDLAETLYPTVQMKQTIITLNCYIMKFLLRALEWYESGTASRAIQSIIRPAALRYDDIISDIAKTLDKVTNIALGASQVEQRQMYEEQRQERDAQDGFRAVVLSRLDEMKLELTNLNQQMYQNGQVQVVQQQIRELRDLINQLCQNHAMTEKTILQEVVLMKQDIKSTRADIRHRLTSVQSMQAFSLISSACPINFKSAYEYALSLRRARRLSSAAKCAPFWNSQQLRTWDQTPSHSSIVLRATSRDDPNIRDFCVNVIDQLLGSGVTVLWILHHLKDVEYTVFDVLKSLIAQELSKIIVSHTDVAVSSYIQSFHAAHSMDDYEDLFVRIIAQSRRVYIIMDTGSISSTAMEDCRRVFMKFERTLSERSPRTALKVMFIGRKVNQISTASNEEELTRTHFALRILPTSKRRRMMVPRAPLRGRPKVGAVFNDDGTENSASDDYDLQNAKPKRESAQ